MFYLHFDGPMCHVYLRITLWLSAVPSDIRVRNYIEHGAPLAFTSKQKKNKVIQIPLLKNPLHAI